ncbi:unnamed protein product [Meloidogyne enterolobii]|uniref:Uncharacterized protein n=1 Tax=Meloidogyne enterolobii TaxID=390850 RepID=A0ACB0ZU78_MELEN
MIYSLPTEAKLDILKFLNYEELYSIKQTNLYFRDFITHFEGELARDELFMIILRDIGQSNNGRLIRPGAGNFNFALFDEQHKEINEQLEEKWNKELENPIPLYLPLQDSDNTVICLSKKVKFEGYFSNFKNRKN